MGICGNVSNVKVSKFNVLYGLLILIYNIYYYITLLPSILICYMLTTQDHIKYPYIDHINAGNSGNLVITAFIRYQDQQLIFFNVGKDR